MSNGRFTYGFAHIAAILAIAAGGIYLGFRGFKEWSLWYWLEQNSSVAEATVVNVRTDSNGDMFYAEYVFPAQTAAGQTLQFDREEAISRSFYSRLVPGTKLEIRYNPDDPTISRIASNRYPYLMNIIMSLGCMFLVAIPWLIAYRLANYQFEPFTLFRQRFRFWRSILRRIQSRGH